MASPAPAYRGTGPRKSILDLAPLELDCMNALWSLQQGTVRQVQQALTEIRPRAYTTIMTILDRLARKGIVTRHKIGRAYLYRPDLSAEDARTHAVEQVVKGFFDGSADALAAHIGGSAQHQPEGVPARPHHAPALGEMPRVGATIRTEKRVKPATEPRVSPPTRMDESLL